MYCIHWQQLQHTFWRNPTWWRKENLKRLLQNKTLIGVGCPAHILNNCVHHGADTIDVDLDNIMFKIDQYFHIYTVHTENLKEYCDFVDIEYRMMLSLSKTRWLSLFPARHWEDDTDVSSFEGTLSVSAEATHSDQEVLYLWHMHSLLSVFHTHIQEMGKGGQLHFGAWREYWTAPTPFFLITRATTSCPLKLRDYWHKSAEMYLVRAVTSSVLMCKACTVHVWSIWRSGWLPWKSSQHSCGRNLSEPNI